MSDRDCALETALQKPWLNACPSRQSIYNGADRRSGETFGFPLILTPSATVAGQTCAYNNLDERFAY